MRVNLTSISPVNAAVRSIFKILGNNHDSDYMVNPSVLPNVYRDNDNRLVLYHRQGGYEWWEGWFVSIITLGMLIKEKRYTPATGDVMLPEIFGNWSNASFNQDAGKMKGGQYAQSWSGGFVQGFSSADNIISSKFQSVVGLFTDKHLPNLGIWHLANPHKEA